MVEATKALYSRLRLCRVQAITSLSGSSRFFAFRLVETRLIVAKKFLTIPKVDRVAPKNSLKRINSEEKPRGAYKRLR